MKAFTQRFSGNIPKLYFAHFFTGLLFFYGIERLFLLSLGISRFGISMNGVLMSLLILLLDVPLGTLADLWGRKRTLLVAMTCSIIACVFFSLSTTLGTYIIGTFFYGLFLVSTSGTYQAMIYDSLHDIGRSNEFNKINGRIYALFVTGIGVAVLCSGFMAQHFGFRFNYRISIVSGIIAFLIVLSMKEPQHVNKKIKHAAFHYIKDSAKLVTTMPILRNTSLLFITLAVFMWMSNEYSQFIFSDFKLRLGLIGIISSSALIAGAIGRFVAHRYHVHTRWLVWANLLVFSLIGIAPTGLVITALIIFYGLSNLVQNNNEAIVQDNLPSYLRATATSFYSFMGSVATITIGIAISFALRNHTIFAVFKTAAIGGLMVTTIWQLLVLLNNRKLPEYTNR